MITDKRLSHKILGIYSITIGILVDLYLLLDWLFVDYFTDVGIEAEIGMFVLFILLIIAGWLLLLGKKECLIYYKTFSMLIVVERLVVFGFFYEYLTLYALFVPLTLASPIIVWIALEKGRLNTINQFKR
ncbi:hypothetical protein EYV94_16415 [Puteibacter caeruleilacunae]|nr:hypothetical protein EYV94_16415 [Puteibacter caeruleilacunae]